MESDRSQTAMSDIIAKPERTYGLVVGIEKYQEASWNVKGGGPVNDALKFADWLCRRGVPKENIRLCLSPLEENNHLVEQLDLKLEEATEHNLSEIIENDLSQKKGDLVCIFWAGHGLLTSERERRLLCADATFHNWRNLNLDSLFLLLKSDSFKIQNHICIFEACADFLKLSTLPKNLKGKEFSSGSPDDSQQFILLATREGEKAKINPQEKTGYFSQAVRDALEQESLECWPPNMEAVAKKVKQQVASLGKKQQPIYFSIRNWDGDTNIYRPTHCKKPEKLSQANDDLATNFSANLPKLLIPDTTTFEFEVVTVNVQGRETKRCPKQAQYFVEILGDGVELAMVSIPGGQFAMGTQEELESSKDELPRHLVTVKPFFMGKYPITQAQWRAIASLPKIKHDLHPDPSYFKGDNRPVERVSWYDADEFCDRLSKVTGRTYRLPSEAEWEYACRARTTTPFHFGATITTNLANFCQQDQSMNKVERKQTTDVGSFPANAFGLYEMHGNVWEWCADNWHEDYQDAPSDGSVWVINGNSEYRILRGGSWDYFPTFCRCTYRFFENPQVKDKEFGFRVVCCL